MGDGSADVKNARFPPGRVPARGGSKRPVAIGLGVLPASEAACRRAGGARRRFERTCRTVLVACRTVRADREVDVPRRSVRGDREIEAS